ncbi:GNAT family N-acetyltransferase [Catenuloplanes atrovinosus]|uniref:GNAT superfamily N-acetyltransferase n=1 Tax=Catenuloplanes atrovinosus TaxID=137266 RepID=A0AAE3YVS8_9ACTN|nr:GNAT family N-acetyltransferase [Catenuloplanes atrovinosus]MDR7279288.1 GNAT superfamily N-acetyltransferase [Catenuloplanes atrovinosus]
MSVMIREIQDRDFEAVGALHLASRVTAYAHILSADALAGTTPGAMAEWWRERYRWEHDTHRFMVADVDGTIAGFTYAGPDETPDAAMLNAIHVAPGRIGSGLGRLLLADVQAWFATHPEWTRARLWVLEENARARGFYEHHGWRFDGTTRVDAIGTAMVPMVRYARELAGA